MTRKHYEAIAAVINATADANRGNAGVLLEVAQGIAEFCADENPAFNRARFISACFAYQQG
jgi:hypothetical protein